MQEKFLKEVVGLVVGKQAEEIVELLDSKKYVNEFILAKKLDITINQTRNILYKLSDSGLVSSMRKKDKKKGWYTYFWKIEVLKSLEFLKDILKKRIAQIDSQIKSRETKQFYVCEKCNIEFNEENALLHNFTCNECGKIFTLKDNVKVLKELKRNKERIEKEIELLNELIKKEKEKSEKVRVRVVKKEKKVKDAERKAKRNLKKKEAGKLEEVVVKKKAIKNKKTGKKKSIKKKELSKKKVKKASKKIGKARKKKR